MIAAGKLNRRVTLEEPTQSADGGGYGEPTQTWSAVRNVGARIETAGGREFYRASQTYSTMSHLVTIRYRKGLTTGMRIKFGTRTFGILGFVNRDEANILLQIACLEAADNVTT